MKTTEEDRPTFPQFRAMQYNLNTSVADPGCLSQLPDPDFPYPGCRIQKQQQKWWVKKSCCHTFLHSHIFLKIENDFSFEELKKKNCANFPVLRIRDPVPF